MNTTSSHRWTATQASNICRQVVRWGRSAALERPTAVVFLGLFAPLVILRLALLLNSRVPIGHDAFQYLHLQYISFNEAIRSGRPPLWYPFLSHGVPAGIWIVLSQGLLTSWLFPLAPLLKGINFLWLYQAGMLFDELTLLLGCVLLGRRCYQSMAAVLFVSAAITYTAISSTQVWFDLHAYYLLPLILYSALSAIETGAPRYLLATGFLYAATVLGNLPYFLPLTAFVLCLFLSIYLSVGAAHCRALLVNWWSGHRKQLPLLFLPAVLMVGTLLIYPQSAVTMAFDHPGRGSDGNVASLTSFLTYGGLNTFWKYWDLLGRFANNMDITLYTGVLVVPFAAVAVVFVRSRRAAVFGLTALVLAMFSANTLVTALFYYAFPLGRLFRHIGLVAPMVKIFLIFYAGFGIDRAWHSLLKPGDDRRPFLIAAATLVLLLVPGVLSAWSFNGDHRIWVNTEALIRDVVIYTGFVIGAIVALILIYKRAVHSAHLCTVILLGLHFVDIGLVKVEREYFRTPRVSAAIVELFRSYTYPFPMYRESDYGHSQRAAALAPYLFGTSPPKPGQELAGTRGPVGSVYASVDSFLYVDRVASLFRTEEWLTGVGAFHNIWIKHRPPGLGTGRLGHPIPDAVGYRTLAGIDSPKLQLFSRIYSLPAQHDVGAALREKDANGGMLFAENVNISSPSVVKTALGQLTTFGFDDHVPAAEISVGEFAFDSIHIRVRNPSSSPAVLYYADGYDPRWRAWVNSREAPTIATNLGYKSVIVPPGPSEVVWEFGRPSLIFLVWLMVPLGIAATCAVVCFLVMDLGRSPLPSQGLAADAAFLVRKCPNSVKRGLVAFGAMYYVVCVLAVDPVRGGLWRLMTRVAPHGGCPGAYLANHIVWLLLVSAVAGTVGMLTRKTTYIDFIRCVVIIGLTMDLAGVVVFGQVADWTATGVVAHAMALACIGYATGMGAGRAAWLFGLLLLILAWLGPLPSLFDAPPWGDPGIWM